LTLGPKTDATLDRLVEALAGVPEGELAKAATTVATMRPQLLRRLVRLAGQPGLARVLGR